jgi:hypothetical protein
VHVAVTSSSPSRAVVVLEPGSQNTSAHIKEEIREDLYMQAGLQGCKLHDVRKISLLDMQLR